MKIITLAFVLPLILANLLLTNVEPETSVISQTTNYLFQVSRFGTAIAIPANSYIQISFPNAYSTSTTTGCQAVDWEGNPTLSCTLVNQILTVNGGFPSDSNIQGFSIRSTGITNPFPATTYSSFRIKIIYPNSTEESGIGSVDITITTGTATCTYTLTDGIVSSRGTLDIVYSSSYITNPSADNYGMKMLMAQSYPSDEVGNDVLPVLNVTNTQVGNYILDMDYTTNIKLTLLMPPSTQEQIGFITLKSENDEGDIDSCSIDISGVSPNVFTNLLVSEAQIQITTNLTFQLQSSFFIMDSDSIVIDFTGTDFDVTGINSFATFVGGISGDKEISRTASTLTISSINPTTLINTDLTFIIKDITMPFTNILQSITFSIETSGGYIRDEETYEYYGTPGTLQDTQIACYEEQIGYDTTCIFTATLANKMLSTDKFLLVFPSGFSFTTSTYLCDTSGTGINVKSTCNNYNSNNTIQVTSLSSSQVAAGTAISITIPLTLPSGVQNYSIQMRTQSNGGTVDSGSEVLTTRERRLLQGQIQITSSSSETDSSTLYTVTLALPLSLGFSFIFQLYIPFTNTSKPSVNGNLLPSTYSSSFLTTQGVTSSSTLEIANFLTHQTTQTITLYGNFSNNGTTYFYFSGYDLTVTQPKQISIFSFSQSNHVVGEVFAMTFSVTDLDVGDLLIFQNADYYSTSQTDCSSNLICNDNGIVEVVTSSATTQIVINLINPSYSGTLTVNLTAYESTGLYKKQTHEYEIEANVLNDIDISAQQTNPYYSENSTYTFNITLTTNPPAAATNFVLNVDISSYDYNNCTCLVGCVCPSSLTLGQLFIELNAIVVRFKLGMKNPTAFLQIPMTSSTNLGQMDQGSYLPSTPCNSPCRSCSSDPDFCLTCYSWQTLNKLRNNNCVENCQTGQYQSSLICETCDSKCTSCQDTSTNCFTCASAYVFYNNACLDECIETTYNNSGQCQSCQANCLSCTSDTVCTECDSSNYLYSESCQSTCPDGTYINTLTNDRICYDCVSPCQTCTRTRCLSCIAGRLLYQGICYTQCPDGSYKSSNDTCSACISPCVTCSSEVACQSCDSVQPYFLNSQCLGSCPSTHYTNGYSCTDSCTSPLYANNVTMFCQGCQSPCGSCDIWSDQCTSCITEYAFYLGECTKNCPTGRYNDGSTCEQCPQNCTSCSLASSELRCLGCDDETYFYGYLCVESCENGTTLQSPYCLSASCDSLTNCVTCSNLKCLECSASYELNTTTNKCEKIVQQTTTITSVSEIPVPFPFLILTILIIVMGFLIQSKFQKMFTPLFIYAFGGLAEVGVLALWIALLYVQGVEESDLGALIRWIGTGIGGIYFIFNLVGFILYLARVRKDRKYKVWQQQDNQCSSCTITAVGFLFSFRFSLLKYSRLGHLQGCSAILSSDNKLSHYNSMGVAAIICICVPSIVISAWVAYLQTKMNYLFFTSIENSAVNLIMIIITIAQLLTPKGFVLEKKDEYKQGHDSDNLEGQSLEQIMMGINVVEEEYHEGKEIYSGDGEEVIRRNEMDDYEEEQIRTSEQFVNRKEEDTKLQFEDQVQRNILSMIIEGEQLQNTIGEAQKKAEYLNKPIQTFDIQIQQEMISIDQSSDEDEEEGSEMEESSQASEQANEENPTISFGGVKANEENPAFSFGGVKGENQIGTIVNKENPPLSSVKKKKKSHIIKKDEEMPIDDEERKMETDEGMTKIKELYNHLEEQEKYEEELKKKLDEMNEVEKNEREIQFERARQQMQRNKMEMEDKLSKLFSVFQGRNKRQEQRKQRLRVLREKRMEEKLVQKQKPIQLTNLIYNPMEEEDEDQGIRKIKVAPKNPFENEDMIWPQTQEKLNFSQNKEWEMQEEKISPHSNQLSQGRQLQQQRQYSVPLDSEEHWPIDPQLEEKIMEVEERANEYIRRKRVPTIVDEFKEEGEEELFSSNTENFLYVQENEEPQLEIQSKIKVPKGRVNRNVINLAPQ